MAAGNESTPLSMCELLLRHGADPEAMDQACTPRRTSPGTANMLSAGPAPAGAPGAIGRRGGEGRVAPTGAPRSAVCAAAALAPSRGEAGGEEPPTPARLRPADERACGRRRSRRRVPRPLATRACAWEGGAGSEWAPTDACAQRVWIFLIFISFFYVRSKICTILYIYFPYGIR
jgi:hypothetical protein